MIAAFLRAGSHMNDEGYLHCEGLRIFIGVTALPVDESL
jgi:hypothetical protein